ncbi:gliding motility-associated C-terminal domain-containing protein [Membranihabitans maritimus]|uniref:T9SS type B sorting domain-containing protein n=1 Tax=Membranihabitans maritimus TaxID=2904244 RepID=UPI001F26E156|nr:gliding motility-associated C-terminal domain-containing protein [Membranihabitans maritimus]
MDGLINNCFELIGDIIGWIIRMKNFLLVASICIFSTSLLAQVAGDICSSSIAIDSIENYCSEEGEFILEDYTHSGEEQPSCYPQDTNEKDIWFRVIPTFENINVIIRGDVGQNKGGTLQSPQLAIYSGSCDELVQEACNSDARNLNVIEITLGDLQIGEEYFIRVGSRDNHEGTFQMCISNFSYTPEYDSDCPTATVLCDKSTLIVQQLSGSGEIADEADNTCLDTDPVTGGDDGNSEISSVWFKWVARNDGDLTFVLDPINPTDDLDFAVYELPGGLDDCGNKQLLRCMASGEVIGEPFSVWEPCTGPTGLATGSTDVAEQRGCQDGDDNFLMPIEAEEGKAYALVVNNFSTSGAGFRLEWGGDADFAAPDAEIIITNPKPLYCPDEEIEFYAVDQSLSGTITEYNWTFGSSATQSQLSGDGPHSIAFTEGGRKPFVLNLESDIGCITPIDTFVDVEERIELNASVDSISCFGYDDGNINLNIDSPSPVEDIFWSDGSIESDRMGLLPGEYEVVVRNETGCSVTEAFVMEEPIQITIDQILTNASCGGVPDGAIQLIANGSFPPFDYNFGSGYSSDDERTDLASGIYDVSVRDNKGCEEDTVVYLNEINFLADNSILEEPLCFGDANGRIELNVEGGDEPYQYDFGSTGNFQGGNVFTGLTAGEYVILVNDNEDCQGYVNLALGQPDSISIQAEIQDLLCFGDFNGGINININGGVPGYELNWDGGFSGNNLDNLAAGDYSVDIVDQNNCLYEETFTIMEPEVLSLDLIDKMDLLCYGDNNGFIVVNGQGGTGSYRYFLESNSSVVGPDFQGLAAGNYTVFVEDENSCNDSMEVVLEQPEELVVTITGDSVLNLGEMVTLTGNYSPVDRMMEWQWEPTGQVSCDTCRITDSQPFASSYFTLTGTDQNGCIDRDSLLFQVFPIRNVGIPNAIIADHSGPNGTVTVYAGPHVAGILEMNVFDRWGNLLFTRETFPKNEYSLGWDGTVNGEKMMPGVYVYTVQVQYIDGVTKLFSGEIVLLD